MDCSAGRILNYPCANRSCVISDISELSSDDKNLLNQRLSTNVETICDFHKTMYLKNYNNLFGNYCCDPLSRHRKMIKKSLRVITSNFSLIHKNLNLVVGKSLCTNCYSLIATGQNQDQNENNLATLNNLCSVLNIETPNLTKYSNDRKPKLINKISNTICSTVKEKLSDKDNLMNLEEENTDEQSGEYDILIKKLIIKFPSCSKSDQIKMLSLLPDSWSINKIAKIFNTTNYMAQKSRDLVKEQGIFPNLPLKKASNVLDEELVNSIEEYYETDSISRILPGRKDSIVVTSKRGEKERKQKRLLLYNVREIFFNFKDSFPRFKISFSKFAELRPKNCITVSSAGTHNSCVCVIHQNFKLLLDAIDIKDYKNFLNSLVCSINNQNCMYSLCLNCPGKNELKNVIEPHLQLVENIQYKRWISTDRSILETKENTKMEFINRLTDDFEILKKHHYIAKSQTTYITDLKQKLEDGQIIVQMDFAENYSFVVQDSIQGFHWNNNQMTLFPMVIYYNDNSKLISKSFCILSDCLSHSTTAVNVFCQTLLEYLKSILALIPTKIIYFSDGAVTHFKNRKYFINLCYHEQDFGTKAEAHFFATAHGKGPCDGIGATTKRILYRTSMQRVNSGQILNTQEAFDFCKRNISGITFFFVTNKQIRKRDRTLKRRYDKTSVVNKTRDYHKFIPLDLNTIDCFKTSNTNEFDRYRFA